MVAGRMCDDPARGSLGSKRKDRIACAPEFEGTDSLQLLAFEMQARAAECIQRSRCRHWRQPGVRSDSGSCGQYIKEAGLGIIGNVHAGMLTQRPESE
jgi:hypothetical protein